MNQTILSENQRDEISILAPLPQIISPIINPVPLDDQNTRKPQN